MLRETGSSRAREFSARIAEGLSDAAGVIGRFTSDIKTFNYPEHVETAHELELAVRSLLPRDIVSEPAVADAFALADRV